MSDPKRIQRKRTAGWRMPAGCVYVGRAKAGSTYGRWGNPIAWNQYPTMSYDEDGDSFPVPDSERRRWAVTDFRSLIVYGIGKVDYPTLQDVRRELAGRNLACWCPEGDPCHGSVLIEVANCPDEKFAELVANHGKWDGRTPS